MPTSGVFRKGGRNDPGLPRSAGSIPRGSLPQALGTRRASQGRAGGWGAGREHPAMAVSWREVGATACLGSTGAAGQGQMRQGALAWRSVRRGRPTAPQRVTATAHRHGAGLAAMPRGHRPPSHHGASRGPPGLDAPRAQPGASGPAPARGCPRPGPPRRPGGATQPGPEEAPVRLRGGAREAGTRGRAQARGACALGPRAGLVVAALRGLAAWRVRPPRRPEGAAGPPRHPPPAAARRGAGPGTPRTLPPAPPGGGGRLRGSDPRPLAPGWDSGGGGATWRRPRRRGPAPAPG